MKEKLYYKVLGLGENNTLRSCVQYDTIAEKTYTLKEWTKADTRLLKLGYGLTVFSSLKRAKTFKRLREGDNVFFSDCSIKSWVIYSCKGIPLETTGGGPICVGTVINFSVLIAFLECLPSGLEWPKGTILCSKVKLIEKVG